MNTSNMTEKAIPKITFQKQLKTLIMISKDAIKALIRLKRHPKFYLQMLKLMRRIIHRLKPML